MNDSKQDSVSGRWLLRIVQYVFSVVAIFLIVEGISVAIEDFPSLLPLVAGALRAVAADVALFSLWMAPRWPLVAALGVTVGGLGSLVFYPVPGPGVILSSTLFWAGVWLWVVRPGSQPPPA